ncbi:MAG: hypothetical protein ABL903_03325 [Methylococcales bacterium]
MNPPPGQQGGAYGTLVLFGKEAFMQSYAWWENIILGALVLMVVVLWMQAGAKSALQRSKKVPSDWGVLCCL